MKRLPTIALAIPLLMALLLGAAARPSPAQAHASAYCSGPQLAVGANWSVCWEIRANEGLAVSWAHYSKPGFDRLVMAEGTIAEIFVPYETGQPRYHDVSYGLGTVLQVLNQQEDCPGGALLAGGRVCRQVESHGLTEKYCAGGRCHNRVGKQLVLSASAQSGAYNYILKWAFHDDGTIEPQVALAGALQFGNTAHTHNVYWRLDMDIGDGEHDRVEEFHRVVPANSNGDRGVSAWTPFMVESFRPNELFTFRKWRVADTVKKNAAGKAWSYELEPSPGNGSLRTTPAEGFTRGELWVTKTRNTERFVATDTQDLLSGYLNGESVNDTDVTLWYAVHAYHEVRSEDAPYMPIEWLGFHLRPRDFFDQNPLN